MDMPLEREWSEPPVQSIAYCVLVLYHSEVNLYSLIYLMSQNMLKTHYDNFLHDIGHFLDGSLNCH